ncbi:DUF6221 family protein [Streptomyces sp. NPDC008222]|uniref:DUF6221 family protein n=1 Tax=Streptomyces sp. NPDC008222 TaxID=3364820 RepID=UPI0036E2532B
MTSDLVVFLRARLDEEAARQRDIWERWHHKDCEAVPDVLNPGRETGFCDCGVPERILADIEADRALLAEYELVADMDTEDAEPEFAYGRAVGLGIAVRHRALRFAAHPDYRQEWRP